MQKVNQDPNLLGIQFPACSTTGKIEKVLVAFAAIAIDAKLGNTKWLFQSESEWLCILPFCLQRQIQSRWCASSLEAFQRREILQPSIQSIRLVTTNSSKQSHACTIWWDNHILWVECFRMRPQRCCRPQGLIWPNFYISGLPLQTK